MKKIYIILIILLVIILAVGSFFGYRHFKQRNEKIHAENVSSNIADIQKNKDTNDNYYNDLWKELKKDSDYGKDYDCSMNNDKLDCYLTDSTITAPSNNIERKDWYNNLLNTMTKFNVEYEDTDELYLLINDNKYQYYEELKETGAEYTICDGDTTVQYTEGMDSSDWLTQLKEADSNGTLGGCRQVNGDGETIHDLDNVFARYTDTGIEYINMKDLNLVDPSSSVINSN